MKLIVTRPQPAADKTAARLRLMGYEVEVSPVLEIVDTGNERPRGEFDAIVVSSANALRILQQRRAFDLPREIPVYTVGDATAEIACNLGFEAVHSADGTANELADLIIGGVGSANADGFRLLYLCGVEITAGLEENLHKNRFEVTRWTPYKADLVNQLTDISLDWLTHAEPVGVLIYSSRSARQFGDILDRIDVIHNIENTHIYSISDAVRNALPERYQICCKSAKSPNENSLFELIDN